MSDLFATIKQERRLKSLTGLSFQEFETLLNRFSCVYEQHQEQRKKTIQKVRKRRVGAGRKPSLPSIESKLLFLLYYLKVYPTFDALADRFGMGTSTAHAQIHTLMPLLSATLEDLGLMPKRSFDNAAAFRAHLENLGQLNHLFIDATEREHFRYKDKEKRDALYSPKKKVHR